jgi:tetratricopeptide (TPR) repeat protein
MKKIIFIICILCSISIQADDSLFINANKDYSNESYSEAIKKYESIINNNLESAELYYNLGNCYYKTEQIHKAIYYYEKTLKYNSDFNDASENILLCQLKLIDKIDTMPELFYKTIFKKIKKSLSFNNWFYLTIIFIWLVFLLSIFRIFKSRNTFFLTNLFIVSLILFFITYSVNTDYTNTRSAIIYASSTNIMSAPSDKSTNLFTLHIGTKINIKDQIGDWLNINISNGEKGWIRLSDIKEI